MHRGIIEPRAVENFLLRFPLYAAAEARKPQRVVTVFVLVPSFGREQGRRNRLVAVGKTAARRNAIQIIYYKIADGVFGKLAPSVRVIRYAVLGKYSVYIPFRILQIGKHYGNFPVPAPFVKDVFFNTRRDKFQLLVAVGDFENMHVGTGRRLCVIEAFGVEKPAAQRFRRTAERVSRRFRFRAAVIFRRFLKRRMSLVYVNIFPPADKQSVYPAGMRKSRAHAVNGGTRKGLEAQKHDLAFRYSAASRNNFRQLAEVCVSVGFSAFGKVFFVLGINQGNVFKLVAQKPLGRRVFRVLCRNFGRIQKRYRIVHRARGSGSGQLVEKP